VVFLSGVVAFRSADTLLVLLDEFFQEGILRFHISLWYLVDVGVVDYCTSTSVVPRLHVGCQWTSYAELGAFQRWILTVVQIGVINLVVVVEIVPVRGFFISFWP
jgi:hypothetical protein